MSTLEHLKFALIRTFVNTSLYIRRSSYLSPTTKPDLTKSYECRPLLYPCRVFLPNGNKSKSGEKYPLVIRAHGGGFIVNNPSTDDPIARHLADTAHCVVVNIDYSKSPQNKFPTAYEDVIAQSLAIIEGEELHIDPSRVVLCGASAGGNLLTAAAQDERLRSRLRGLIAIYPVLDMVPDWKAKMATRPDASIPDFIGETWAGLKSLYFDPSNEPSLTDVRASPSNFESRNSLPPDVLLIGAEHDMFCHEDEQMAQKLAGDGTKSKDGDGWRAPGVRWHKVYGQPHAFDVFPVKHPEKEKARAEATERMHAVLTEWLGEVFNGPPSQ